MSEQRSALDAGLVRGVAWMGLTKAAAQLLSWASVFIVARLLSRDDYGVAAASATVIGLIGLVTEFGLGTAVVSKSALTDRQITQLAGVGILGGMLAWMVAGAAWFVMPSVYSVPQLRGVLPVSGLVVALAASVAVPQAMLKKSLAFQTLARIDFTRMLVSSAAILVLAYLLRSYWAIILAEVLAASVAAILYFRTYALGVTWPVWRDVASALKFSTDVLIGRVSWYVYSNADFAMVGRVRGAAALGDYSMAWSLVTMPNEKIATLVFGVTPSVFARVREDLPEFRRYFLLLIEMLSTILMPLCVGMAVVAPELIAVALGNKWQATVPVVQGLALFAAIRALSPLSAQVLVSRGRTAVARRFSLLGALVLPLGFYLAAQRSINAVALVWSVVFPILAYFQLAAAAREIALPMREVLRAVQPSVVGTALMGGLVWLARPPIVARFSAPLPSLLLCVALGAACYVGWLWIAARPRLLLVWRLVRTRSF